MPKVALVSHNHAYVYGCVINVLPINYEASGEVQDELSGLGVSVYNQDEFEAGVLEQLDKEVQKRNAEQQRKFLLKEYSSIKEQIR